MEIENITLNSNVCIDCGKDLAHAFTMAISPQMIVCIDCFVDNQMWADFWEAQEKDKNGQPKEIII